MTIIKQKQRHLSLLYNTNQDQETLQYSIRTMRHNIHLNMSNALIHSNSMQTCAFHQDTAHYWLHSFSKSDKSRSI